jgi:hypothetical protein
MTERHNNAPRTRGLRRPTATAGTYAILDRETGRPYLDMGFADEGDANELRRDLMRHYPFKSRWRRRIYVARVGEP